MNDEDRIGEPAGPERAGDETAETRVDADEGTPRRLTRSRRDRMIAGVAGGLGRYFAVDPVIFRIGFAVSLFFGGLGLVAYIALALFVPDEDGGPAPIARSRTLTIAAIVVLAIIAAPFIGAALFWTHGGWGFLGLALPVAIVLAVYLILRERDGPVTPLRVLAAVAIVLAATAGLFVLAAIGVFATATGHGLAAAIVVGAIGLALVAAAFRGGARWLIAPAVALGVGVGVAAAANLHFHGGVGDRDYRPVSVASIPPDGYDLAVGRLAVDLRGLDWRRHRVVDLDTELGVGEMVVAVPSNVCVDARAHADVGEVNVAGTGASGVDVSNEQGVGSAATPRLRLDAKVDAGQLRVLNSDDASVDNGGFDHFSSDVTALRSAENRACAG